jgi:predicted NBD/HSP70 family sugar kinase
LPDSVASLHNMDDPATLRRVRRSGGFSQGDLRRFNELRILEYVREYPGRTQVEIARGVGLTRAAVSKLIGPDNARQPRIGLRAVLRVEGSRPSKVYLESVASCVIAVDIGVHHVRGRCTDLSETPVCDDFEAGSEQSLAVDSERALELAAFVIRTMLERAKEAMERRATTSLVKVPLAGIVLGLPFPVDGDGAVIGSGEWRYVQLPSDLWLRLGWSAPADVVLDAHLGAIAELDAALADDAGLKGLKRESTTLVYAKWSSSATGALVIDGELHRGFRGMAGSFLHVPLPDEMRVELPPCDRCNLACVNAKASLKGIVARLAVPETTYGADAEERARRLVAAAREGGPEAPILAEAAEALGYALGLAINTVNPRLVIVGGAFHATDYTFLSRHIHRGIERTAIPQLQAGVLIQSGRRTGQAALAGGVAHGLRKFAAEHLLEKTRAGVEPADDQGGDE